jgi:Methyltransferase domain
MNFCSLCLAESPALYQEIGGRQYFGCQSCGLIQLSPFHHLSTEEERKHYDCHKNGPDELGYRGFLDRICCPLHNLLVPGSVGLDFGSGPGPVLAMLMREKGHQVENYDPYYAPDPTCLNGAYDFITLTEVAEHLKDPSKEIARLWNILNVGGYLAIMTQMTDGIRDFEHWYYRRDPTHVCFWSISTMRWLASNLEGAELILPGAGLTFFRKRSIAGESAVKVD